MRMEHGLVVRSRPPDVHNGDGAPISITSDGNNSTINGHKKSLSSTTLSKLSFLRASAEDNQLQADHRPSNTEQTQSNDPPSPKKTSIALAVAVQQKTRRRKGSLRKAALLGRGAQREKKELEMSPLNSNVSIIAAIDGPHSPEYKQQFDGLGIGPMESLMDTSDASMAQGVNENVSSIVTEDLRSTEHLSTSPTTKTSPTLTYISTTDEEDILSIPKHHIPNMRGELPLSSNSDSYFQGGAGSLSRRRSTQKPTSPLSLGGMPASSLPAPDAGWDYSATEWWGWVILIMTWIVFVIGMGSCLGVWSWAWDVGETPNAPLELSDDHTLPIVGYYPALIILTAVMAWVWVVVAWVGMKYFRHAKISGD